MSGTASRFTISAFCEQGYIQATRCNRASAMCLADDWAESGFSDIQITSPDGVTRSPDLFRAGLPLVALVSRRRRKTQTL